MLTSDYYKTGKMYRKIDAYVYRNKPCGQCFCCRFTDKGCNCLGERYFGSTVQFKSLKNFKAFLSAKHPGSIFSVYFADRHVELKTA